MTINTLVGNLPFLHRFARPIPDHSSLPLRYDAAAPGCASSSMWQVD